MFLDSWKSQEVEDTLSGTIQFQENYEGKVQVKNALTETYIFNKIS